VIYTWTNDKSDIISKRNSLCGKINNVLCYFSKCVPLVKLKLLRSYCSDFYGCVLWDLSDNAVDNVCVAWRKGLRRTLDLPACTHSRFVAPVCGLLPLRDEFVRRCASFIFTCLSSDNIVVKAISRNGVYFMRMLSPLGRNAQQCCNSFGLSLHNIHAVCNKLAWSLFYRNLELPELDKIRTIKELLCVKYGLVSLPLFDISQIDFMLESLCTQ